MADQTFGQMRQEVLTVPTGDFIVRCVKTEAVKNSKGDPMIKTQLEVIAGPMTGRKFTNNFNIMVNNPGALAMFFRQMEKFGLDEAYFNTLPNNDSGVAKIANDLIGRVVEVNVAVRTWNGADMPDIKEIRPAPAQLGGTGTPTATATALPTALPAATPTVVAGSAAVNLPMTIGDSSSVVNDDANESVATPTGTEPSTAPPERPF